MTVSNEIEVYHANYSRLRKNLVYCMDYYDGALAGVSRLGDRYVYWTACDELGNGKKCRYALIPECVEFSEWLDLVRENIYWWWYEDGQKSAFFDNRPTPLQMGDHKLRFPFPEIVEAVKVRTA